MADTLDHHPVVPLNYTLKDVVEWLDQLPPDTIVHNGEDNICEECTLARFFKHKLNDQSLTMAFTTVRSEDTGVVFVLQPEIGTAVHRVDERAVDAGSLTASEAKEILGGL